jgi:hypothetical protein
VTRQDFLLAFFVVGFFFAQVYLVCVSSPSVPPGRPVSDDPMSADFYR